MWPPQLSSGLGGGDRPHFRSKCVPVSGTQLWLSGDQGPDSDQEGLTAEPMASAVGRPDVRDCGPSRRGLK